MMSCGTFDEPKRVLLDGKGNLSERDIDEHFVVAAHVDMRGIRHLFEQFGDAVEIRLDVRVN